ncbi:hypothetical protein MFLAVUS_000710 [Mucor flavus]|uniref:C2H2-type domain-containing protein n=1 Tax=Mucor flavus TaxID=439312 RepID=A0ABP9YKH5_9FUNG
MTGIHSIDIEIDGPSLVDGAVKPDPHDPDYYCLVCETCSSNKTDYCNHLQQEHGIKFKTVPFLHNSKSMDYNDAEIPMHRMEDLIVAPRKIFKEVKKRIEACDFLPNPNDPNFYCRVCELTLSKQNSLISHIREFHNLDTIYTYDHVIAEPSLLDRYPEYCNSHFVCKRCDEFSFETQPKFHDHLRTVHQVQLPTGVCGNFHCQNVAEDTEYKCRPCTDGNTVKRRIFETKPKAKANRQPLVSKYIPPAKIDLESDSREEVAQTPTVSVGQGNNMFSVPPPQLAETRIVTFEDLIASTAGGFNRMTVNSNAQNAHNVVDDEEDDDDNDEDDDEVYIQDVKLEGGENPVGARNQKTPRSEIAFCSICSISFKEPQEYVQHLDVHCVELKDAKDGDVVETHGYTCTTCHVKYDTKGRFIRHMSIAPIIIHHLIGCLRNQIHDKPMLKFYKCPKCKLTFDTKQQHLDHLEQNHINEIYRLKYIRSLVDDGMLHTIERFYSECEDCDESYSSLHSLKVHRRNEHTFLPDQETDVARYYDCRKQLGIPSPKYSCTECGIKVKKALMKEHCSLHDWRPLSQANKFFWHGIYAINQLQDLNEVAIPPFYCGPCGKILNGYPTYRNHVVNKHNVRTAFSTQKSYDLSVVPDIDDPRFYCKSRDFKFAARDKYRRHLKTFHEMLLPKLRAK